MPSISERFAERRTEGRATLVPYVTSGFPSRAATVDVLTSIAEAGGDVDDDPAGLDPSAACKASIVEPLSDDADLRRSMTEIIRDFF